MPANDRGGLKAAFSRFKSPDAEKEAELRLLGRTVEPEAPAAVKPAPPITSPSASTQPVSQQQESYPIAIAPLPVSGGLTPKPLLQREAVRQLSFRCPVSIASELRRRAAFNQLEQQEIIVEGIRRVLRELPDPPAGWEL
jgi:hypothetical protein